MDFQKKTKVVNEFDAFNSKYSKVMREKNRELQNEVNKAKGFNKVAMVIICVLIAIMILLGIVCAELLKSTPESEKITANTQNANVEAQTVKASCYSDFMAWEPYTAITAKGTLSYKLTRAATYDKYGLLIYDNSYLIALGSGWGKVGDKMLINLSNGNSFTAIIADQKADKDTDTTNRYCLSNGSVIEFIINPYALDKRIKKLGTVSSIPEFKGQIINIIKI